jgi:ribose-phosphate pyrophosphokinase
MFAMPVFENYLVGLEQPLENPVVVSPDAGGVDRARALARRLDAGLAIIDKRRSGPNVAHVMHVIGDVKGRDCIIVDDMVDTAGTLTKAAKALQDNGARRVKACCIHAILSGPAMERIEASCIEELIITNSVFQTEEKKLPNITCLSVGSLMAETIRRIHREESVSTLFHEMS